MNRRLASLAAAAALVIMPAAAAQAYVAPGVDLEVSDSTPAPGQPISVVFEGTTVGENYTLTITSNPASIPSSDIQIAGTASLTKTATGPSVTFTVTLRQAASYRTAITDASGALLADSTLVVQAPGAAATPAPGRGGALATTGADSAVLVGGAAALVLVGGTAVLVARRRKTAGSAQH